MECHALVLDSSAHISVEALRIAAATARVRHVDLLVKTSDRIGIAEICDLPVAGFVVADCDARVLRDVEVGVGRKDGFRPFVVAIVESMAGLRDLDVVARSSHVDALVVGAGDLARNARLAGADPERIVADAHVRVRSLAAREGKILAAAPRDRKEAEHARKQGAKLVFQGSDITILSEGLRAAVNDK
jgi:citrate lyase beta subunit